MIKVAVGLKIDARNVSITINGDSALVEFDQYYRSLNLVGVVQGRDRVQRLGPEGYEDEVDARTQSVLTALVVQLWRIDPSFRR